LDFLQVISDGTKCEAKFTENGRKLTKIRKGFLAEQKTEIWVELMALVNFHI